MESHWHRALFLAAGIVSFIGELLVHRKYGINHIKKSGNTCSHEKKEQMSLHGESQFDSQLSWLLQLTMR
jgi:hypothetical protein